MTTAQALAPRVLAKELVDLADTREYNLKSRARRRHRAQAKKVMVRTLRRGAKYQMQEGVEQRY